MTSTMRFDKWENTLGQPVGTVLQVKHMSFTSTFATTTIGSWVTITGYNLTITPRFANSRILITPNIGRATGSNSTLWRVVRDGSTFSLPDSAGSRLLAHFANSNQGADGNHADGGLSMVISDLPNSTSELNYQVQILNEGAGNHSTTFALNRNFNNVDSGLSYHGRTISTLTIWEIAQ
jgi:hypothetical protein